MGIREELKQAFGEDFLEPRRWGRQPSWHDLCVCGHIDWRHGRPIGGSFLEEEDDRTIGGQPVHYRRTLNGCAGAMAFRGFDKEDRDLDHVAGTAVVTVKTTCPCVKFQPVARIDRPGRYFNQRIPRDLTAYARHPFATGVRAYLTFLSGQKSGNPDKGGDPDWVPAEFDRRFVWLDRRCAHLTCHTTAEVWPVYVDADPARSELRCPLHR